MKTLRDFKFKDKRVLVRCDFNVPLDEKGNILDDFRIKKTIPTIEYLIEKGAKVILMSHLDDPGGKVVENLRLKPVQEKLKEYLERSVIMAPDCISSEVEKLVEKMKGGEILLLENLRFHKKEEENDEIFAKNLSKLGDIFIQEAFGACHRAHASIVSLPKYLSSGIGFLLEKEVKVLNQLLKNPKKPLIAIIGGKKVETKSKTIDRILEKADWILINHLIKNEIEEKKVRLKYPQKIIKPLDAIDEKGENFDIGPRTRALFKEKIALAKTIFWSGPLGMIEKKEFSKGSEEIAKAIIESGAFSVVGGGETIEFINKIGLTEKFSHISTGGGAMLDFIVDGKLIGIEALK